MGTKISELTADTSITGVEYIPILDGSTNKKATVDQVVAYAIDELIASDTATATTGDYLLGYRSTTEKSYTLDDVAAYAVKFVYGDASALTPAASGDLFIVDRSGTQYTMDIDVVKTYVNTGLQATILDLSGLSAATLANTDLLAICQTSTAKKATISALETLLWTDFATYAGALSAVSTVADADKIYMLQSGVPKYCTATILSDYVVAEILASDDLTADILGAFDDYVEALDEVTALASTDEFYVIQSGTAEKYVTLADISDYIVADAAILPWLEVDTGSYTALPASTSTITMSDTSDFNVGYGVKYVYGGVTYYGVVTAVTTNTLLTIAGAPLDTGTALTALYAGGPERVIVQRFFVGTDAFATTQDVFEDVTYERFRWEHGTAFLVTFAGTLGVVDTGASQPKLNIKVNSHAVSTADSGNGIQMSGTEGTWTANSAVAIDTSYYDINRTEPIDIQVTAAGTNGDADCLSMSLTFVLE